MKMTGMNNLYKTNDVVKLKIFDGQFQSIQNDSTLYFNDLFNITNLAKNIVVQDAALVFDGSYSIISSNKHLLNFNRNTYTEFDVLVSNTAGVNNRQTIFSLVNGTLLQASFDISIIDKFAALTIYNTSNQEYCLHHVYHNFLQDVFYNFKIITFNNGIYIYVNDKLKYRSSNIQEQSGKGTSGPIRSIYENCNIQLGQLSNIVATNNLKGQLKKFATINFVDFDSILNSGTDIDYENLLYHIPFEYIGSANLNASRPIRNIGQITSVSNIGPSGSNTGSTQYLFDLSDTYWWYQSKTSRRITIPDNVIKNNTTFSIIFKMKTGDSLTAGTIFDTRSVATAFNNMTLSISTVDISTFTLRFSTVSSTTSWSTEHIFNTGLLVPNTEYVIGLTRQNNTVKLFVNKIEVGSLIVDFSTINWTTNTIDFFNSVDGGVPNLHYIQDLRIYKSFIIDAGILDNNKLFNIAEKDYTSDILNDNIDYYFNNRKELKYQHTDVSIDFDKINNNIYLYNDYTIESSQFKLFAEGFKNKNITVYLDGVWLFESSDVINLSMTNKSKKYTYKIGSSNLIRNLPNKSMILGQLSIYLDSTKCTGSDFYVRLHRNDTGEFIGEYDLINNTVAIHNLDYNNYYDAILIDRNKVLENIVRSKLKPILVDDIQLPESKAKIRELSYYEACLKYTKDYIDAQLLINPNKSLVSIDVKNTSKDVDTIKVYQFDGELYNEINTANSMPIIRVKTSIGLQDHDIYIKGEQINRIAQGSIIEIDNELLYVNSIDINIGLLNVNRGIIDTHPEIHVTDSIINILAENVYIDQFVDQINIKAVSIGSTENKLEGSEDYTIGLINRMMRPSLPSNVKINGKYYPTSTIGPISLSWSQRNLLLETGNETTDWFEDATVQPEGITYSIYVYNHINDELKYAATDITSLTHIIGMDSLLYTSIIRLELFSVRGSYYSRSQVYVIERPYVQNLMVFDGNYATDNGTTIILQFME